MKNKAKKAATKATKGSTKKAKATSKAKSKAKSRSTTKKSATKKSAKPRKSKVTAKGATRRSAATKTKNIKAGSKKRRVQKKEEMPLIIHGTDQHFIPSHQSGTEMPHMDEKILHNKQQAAMNQENQKVKNMVTRGGAKRVFRILGR